MLYSKLEVPGKFRNEKSCGEISGFHEEIEQPVLLLRQPNSVSRISQLYQQLLAVKRHVIWYNLDYLDNEEAVFLKYLKAALEKEMKGLRLEELYENKEKLKIPFCHLKCMEQIICRVMEYLSENADEKYCLILYNFQEIENKIIHKMIQQLMDNMPKGMQLVLSVKEEQRHLAEYAMGEEALRAGQEGGLQGEEAFLTPIYISFFGGLHVRNTKSGEELCWRTRKEKQLFAYLFNLNGRAVVRSNLLETLWEEGIPENAIAMLHNMIYHIRKEMDRICQCNIIKCEKKNIIWKPEAFEAIYTKSICCAAM